ncbi:MAG TPA: hypothetical protein VE199_01420 [Nitrososphaera sp.]|nr:hypothetical protein [Nitrososphaera sp.]
MKSPICSFDAKSGVLCTKCEEKLHSGGISQDDVDASTRLTRLAERDSNINKFTLVRAARVDEDFVLVLRRPDVSALRSNASLADKIEREFGQKVWFAESEASDRRFIENLLHPLKVTAVNQFWLPDGNKLTKVIVSQKVQFDMEKVQKIARAVRGIELLVEFQ